ncbi:fatty-acid amide hydrolase 2 [Terrapene carolina triunguis]|uniref:fatty-acid amide hydrolase 2 n=1 Tax=Terrapene triunguis TaxID=2587831 RepID=UPI000E77B756|nr:fatty-acid amide hydrolase 2 [Terrapene carolina triunguis]
MALSRAERCLVLLLRLLSRAFLVLLSLAARASAALAPTPPALPPPAGATPARCVPPPSQPLLLLSARQLARRIRCREVKCTVVVQAYIKRIEEINPLVNAVVKARFDAALQEAHHVDKLLSEGHGDEDSLQEKFPFLGVPFTVKEAFALHGGEGCVLGAACSVIGVGSDIGGSIRMPAFFNGVFGHKPTTGVVPNDGQFPNALGVRTEFLCTGPMCRYAEDLEPMLRVMAGPGVRKLKLDEKVSLEKVKFYCMEHDGGSVFVSPVDREILQAQRKVVEHLETQCGVQVQHVTIHKMKYAFQIWSAMMSSRDSDGQVPQLFTDLLGDHGKPVWPLWELMKWFLGMSLHTIPAIALALTEKLMKLNPGGNAKLVSMGHSLRTEMMNLLGTDGILLYPSHPIVAPKHYSPLGMPFNFAYTAVFNVLGLPVTQCPLGLSSEGLPLGIQVVAGPHNDHLTLAMARYLEKAFGGWVCPGKS